MRLTLLVLSRDGEKKLARILPELRWIADELVIGVDDTTTDASAEVARQFTDRVYPVPHAGFAGRGRAEDLNAVECMLPHCRGDWLLRIDHDETLSPHWHDRGYVTALLDDRYATHYWIPRRWVVPPGDRYISNGHWHPDYQLRLFRNIPSLVNFNRTPHAPPFVAGERSYLTDSWILHWDYVWHDRRMREAKVAFYREIRSYAAEEFYLYENRQYETRPLDFTWPAGSGERNGRDAGGPFSAVLEIVDCPASMRAGETATMAVRITNLSNRMFRPESTGVCSGNVLAAYHWRDAEGRPERNLFEGARHSMPKRLWPGESTLMFLRVEAPGEPGDYLWEPDLVEEGVAWFSSHVAIPSCAVRVIGPVATPGGSLRR